MSCKNIKLGNIPIIANSLKCGTTRAVKTLNSILGFTEFDRSSRNKIRNFSTFPKEFRVEEYKEKILTEFSLPDFISVTNLLHLDVETNEQNLCNSIFKALTNLDEFQLTLNNSEASFSEGENVVSKTTFQKRITLDRNSSSEGTDQHSPFQHPNSNSPLPSVQGYSFMPAHRNVSSLCTQNTFPPYSNDASLTEMNTPFWTLLRDISATSRKFTGEDFFSVNSFFRDVEENFNLFPAISSQKLIFAKRLVCGTAKSFLFSQRNLNTYESFKKALIEEFSDSVTSIEIHRELEKRKMYKTETLMQYFNSMRELANRCDSKIDEASIIQYLDIALTDDEPIFHKPRRLPFAERDIVDDQVDEWVKNGIVEPCSSPYASQVVLVKKKDGKSRVCIDYRRLNRKLIKDNYPLPLIDDILDCLQNAKIFTTLDLKNEFFHVAVNERSRKFTGFVTHNGQYQFRRMPFGLSTCPSTFMRYINAFFRHLISKSIVLPYMDDVVIPAANESQALEYLKIVLQVACDYGLEINFKKCQFLHNTIEFLGHIIENGRLFPSPSKTKAVINYPDLKNIKDVRRFLGLTGYFRKFLPSYSTIAKPLSDLLRKDSLFQFYAEQRTAFQKLRYLLSQQPVLCIFNQNSPTEIHTDASIDGLGAVLLQKSIHDNQFHPVFYMSKKTSDHERKYTSFELEVLAVVEALKKFRIYVLGTSFKIITDCDALVKTLSKKELNPRIARWALYLQEFNYTIEHRTGSCRCSQSTSTLYANPK
ncbi:retrovirus-related Pol polyprotein from transposon 297 [Trichonephila clavipes]|nr:retrovirus-related Pol polyprotein from transposon 297 [Trichonephila clavipes]